MTELLQWKRDHVGEELWHGEEYLGCIYDRKPNRQPDVEWRALDADFRPVGSSLDVPEYDPRLAARLVLVAHVAVGDQEALMSASELLQSTHVAQKGVST